METNWIFIVATFFVVMTCFICVYLHYDAIKSRRKAEEAEKKRVKPGYYWYEDDTFSKSRIPDKKVKAIVELVEEDCIYGDLTVSELFPIDEQRLSYDNAEKFFEEFSYPCKDNEKIVWYDIYQLSKIKEYYSMKIERVVMEMSKSPRRRGQWSCSKCLTLKENAFIMDFHYNASFDTPKVNENAVRPVIAMKYLDTTLITIENFDKSSENK